MAIPRNLSNLAPGADSSGVLGVTKGGTGAASLTANNVLLGNGTSAVQLVAPGSSGNVLTSNGTTWASSALPASGAYTFVSTLTANNTANFVEWTGLTGDKYVIMYNNQYNATNSTQLLLQFGSGSPVTYVTSGYGYVATSYVTSVLSFGGAGRSNFVLNGHQFSMYNLGAGATGFVQISGMSLGYPSIGGASLCQSNSTPQYETAMIAGSNFANSTAKTAIKIYASSGNLFSGSFSLYAISN